MSATPIPRTLAIIVYGDLDISVIDELPAQRLPIKNCVVDTSYRPSLFLYGEADPSGTAGLCDLSNGGGKRRDGWGKCAGIIP